MNNLHYPHWRLCCAVLCCGCGGEKVDGMPKPCPSALPITRGPAAALSASSVDRTNNSGHVAERPTSMSS